MKTILLSLSLGITLLGKAQTTATNFSVADCNGANADLYAELEQGKVIVLAWVMPCFSCISGPLEAYSTVEDYTSSNPGKVEMWVADDYANTNCSTLRNWLTNNGMPNARSFSNTAVNMSNYGQAGMPKIVVLGCSGHKVYYNSNNDASGVRAAIDQALAECALSGINETHSPQLELSVNPNPNNGTFQVNFNVSKRLEMELEIIDISGKLVHSQTIITSEIGMQSTPVTAELAQGQYFIRLTSTNHTETVSFIKE